MTTTSPSGRTRRFSPTLLLCAAGALAAVAGLALPATSPTAEPTAHASAGAPAAGESTTIEIVDFEFSAATVRPGETVEVLNADGVPHTLTAENEAFDTGVISGNATGAFNAPERDGTVAFFCALHPTMRGELIVES